MTNKEIYDMFHKIGCLVFTTIDDNNTPISRIAHFFATDELGLYIRTMEVKPFYAHMKNNKKVSVCGMSASTEVKHDAEGMPLFLPGFTIRLSGDVEEVDIDYIKEKSTEDKDMLLGYNDYLRYPNMRFFRMHSGVGEVYDYDFECENRDHKLLRYNFTLGNAKVNKLGIEISDKCVKCGLCIKNCTFKAISLVEGKYVIDHNKCDACGTCHHVCKFDAIEVYK